MLLVLLSFRVFRMALKPGISSPPDLLAAQSLTLRDSRTFLALDLGGTNLCVKVDPSRLFNFALTTQSFNSTGVCARSS